MAFFVVYIIEYITIKNIRSQSCSDVGCFFYLMVC